MILKLTVPERHKEVRINIEGALQQVLEKLIQILKRELREQTQGRNHTPSLITGHNKVGTDSLFPPIPGFPGYDLQNSPQVSMSHGEEAPGKNKVSFEQWLFEIRSVQGLYSEPFLRKAVINSLEGYS